MNFIRMGDVDLADFKLYPRYEFLDGICLSFDLMNTDVLKRAHFYDEVKKAHLEVYITYSVEVSCEMRSGHTVKMSGKCTPNEYQHLLDRVKNNK